MKKTIVILCALALLFGFWYHVQVSNILTPTLRGEIGEQPSASFCYFAEAIHYPGFTAQDRWQCARVIHIVGSGETPKGLKEGMSKERNP